MVALLAKYSHYKGMKKRWILPLIVIASGSQFLLSGCTRMGISKELRAELGNLQYPKDAEYAPNADLVAVRNGSNLHIANRTARRFAGMQLWINQQYVYPIGDVEIGTMNPVDLDACTNKFEQPFPEGSFLRPEAGFPVVLAELYSPQSNLKYRINVQPPNKGPRILW